MYSFFFFNDTATTEIYTLSLHDALPICRQRRERLNETMTFLTTAGALELPAAPAAGEFRPKFHYTAERNWLNEDRKSTRLNSSHANISYAVFCLKKKKHTHSFPLLFILP